MPVELPPLPYKKDALSPHISEETVTFHYEKHHAGYVTKLNAAIQGTDWDSKFLTDIIAKSEAGIFNNAAQIWNHTFYWNSLSPTGGNQPTGAIKDKIDESFGSFSAFKEQFSTAATTHFGSGWAWLLLDKSGKLVVSQTHDAGCPIREDKGTPLLTCDVWEHAYYINYRNDRAKYVAAFWNIVNWDFANKNLAAAKM